jgi:TRAP-type C4-dicarboxylate transport system substrate-binding protein
LMRNHETKVRGSRRILGGLAFLLGLSLLFSVLFCRAAVAAPPQYEIKIATLAPENSSLMQIFNEMNSELLKETDGKVGFKMFPGFVLGDEEDVFRKLHIGLVQAAVFTSTALTDIDPDLRVLQVPFLFHNYGEVDYVMSKMEGRIKDTFAKKGYVVLGFPELGFIYFMSTTPISSIEDLKGKKVWAKANAPMSDAMINEAGVSTVAINTPDVLMALQTNLLDVVYNSPYYALVTQWNTRIKYITDLPLSYIGGALIMNKKAFDRIPAPLQETLRKVCAKYIRVLIERTRKDNADAMDLILKRGVKKVTPDEAQVQGFKKMSAEGVKHLDPKFFPRETLDKVNAWLAEYRAQAH